jgi:hypothetical protein
MANRRHDEWLRVALDRADTRSRIARFVRLDSGEDGASYARAGIALGRQETPQQTVILSGGYRDDIPWLHVSTAWRHRLPTWEELHDVRELFLDDALVAVQVFPPKAEYINVHPFCLHLYARADGERTVPDLRIVETI